MKTYITWLLNESSTHFEIIHSKKPIKAKKGCRVIKIDEIEVEKDLGLQLAIRDGLEIYVQNQRIV